MKTIEKKQIEFVYNEKDLSELAKGFCNDVQEIIEEREYQISDESRESLEKMSKHNWISLFGNMSKNRRKKFNKYLRRFNNKKSLYSINLFFHFLYKDVLTLGEVDEKKEEVNKWWTRIIRTPKGFKKVKVEPSKKHLTIQEKRKKWKEAQAIANQLLTEYKEEKGDYYKKTGV